jgi:hypothetical protein
VLAAEDFDRGYHATAVLLPDATVLSAGGGEGGGAYAQRNGQIFYPPYLFRGPRPAITSCPDEVTYNKSFPIGVSGPEITSVVLIRLSSVTHAMNQSQRINFLKFAGKPGELTIDIPPNGNVCPPGHYMLFVLSGAGVPSHATILHVGAAGAEYHVAVPSSADIAADPGHDYNFHIKDPEHAGVLAGRMRVTIGLTSSCPYGLGACWGGAYEALHNLEGVDSVYKIPDAQHSTAQVFLKEDGLPDIAQWQNQLAESANGSYHLRGVELSLTGTLESADGHLQLQPATIPTKIILKSIKDGVKVQWDPAAERPRDPTPEEHDCYSSLQANYESFAKNKTQLRLTGPLVRGDGGWTLFVRRYRIVLG